MKKIYRVSAFILIFTLFGSLFSACSSDKISDKATVEDISAAVVSAIGGEDNMVTIGANYIKGMFKLEDDDYVEYVAKSNAFGVNVDEYGIFKGKDEAQTKEIADAVKAYLDMRIETWMPEYMPEEFPKMQAAEYKTLGNYVMYAILWDEQKTAAFEAFENVIKNA